MLVNVGDKVHYMRRRLFKEQPKRHHIGEVVATEDGVMRVRSVLFMGSQMSGQFTRMGDFADRFAMLVDSLTLVTVLPADFDVASGTLLVEQGVVSVTDGRHKLVVDQIS
ncbi:MAG: hypothetical protein WD711_09370 [Dongiaceae bacterium]